jgi:hypothetical protein
VIYIILAISGFVLFRLVQDDDYIEFKLDGSQEEWLEIIRRNIESLSRLERVTLQESAEELRLAITRERENFAVYIANPSRAFNTNLSRGEVIYKVLLSFGYLILMVRIPPPISWP